MFAPVPLEPVFTEGRRLTVKAEVPRFLDVCRLLRVLFSTFVAVVTGGGGAGGGGAGGGGNLGLEHILVTYG